MDKELISHDAMADMPGYAELYAAMQEYCAGKSGSGCDEFND